MTIHLIKLAVGAVSVDSLRAWQTHVIARRSSAGLSAIPVHETRQTPRRTKDLLGGGSLYWVIKGQALVRQRVLDLEAATDEQGRELCRIHLDPVLVETEARPVRPFQGWRYLQPDVAPRDLADGMKALDREIEAALKDALVW